jgi:DNA-binding NarL/FixJ family response regulator
VTERHRPTRTANAGPSRTAAVPPRPKDQPEERELEIDQGLPGSGEVVSLEAVAPGSAVVAEQVIRRLGMALCLRDADTARHIERVSLTASALADWTGLVVDPPPAMLLAAGLHDVGKIGVPDWVLRKPDRLSAGERAIVELHCEVGHALLSGSDSPVLELGASIALNHHERWDGTGYPKRRGGDQIPMEALVTSVADVFDVLTRGRFYRAALPVDTAVEIMLRERGGLFAPDLLDLFLDRLDDVLAITRDFPDPPQRVPMRILIVGAEPLGVDGLLRLVNRRGEMRVVGTANTLADALEAVGSLCPDVLLSDELLEDGDVAALTELVVAQFPETKVLVLAGVATPDIALRSISAGCSGVVAKTATVDDVVRALRRVHQGEVVIPSTLLPEIVSGLRHPGRRIGDEITPREREVLGHLASGLSLPDIAVTMFISINTARNHTQRVIEKLGAHSKLEAVVIAMREGLEMTPRRPSTGGVGADLALPRPDVNSTWRHGQIGKPASTSPR